MIDHLRDRRSILIAMIYPLMGPILLGLMFNFVGGGMRVSEGAPLVVPVVNPGGAPDLMRYLESQGATIEPVFGNVRAAVVGGRLPLAMIVPTTPAQTGDGPIPVRLLTNPSRFDSIVANGRVMGLLNDYQHETLVARLEAAGLPSRTLDVLKIDQENVGRAAGPSVILLTMIPPFLIFTLFTGGVHVALDSTSG